MYSDTSGNKIINCKSRSISIEHFLKKSRYVWEPNYTITSSRPKVYKEKEPLRYL